MGIFPCNLINVYLCVKVSKQFQTQVGIWPGSSQVRSQGIRVGVGRGGGVSGGGVDNVQVWLMK